MNFKGSCLVSTLVIATLAASACTRSSQEPANATKTPSRSALQRMHETARPWDDWMVIHGDQYIPVVNALGQNFQTARESFLQMDFQTAAQETRKAVEFLKAELATASAKDKPRIEASIRDLNRLAAQLDHQKVESLAQIDAVFGEAHQADMERNWIGVGVENWSPMTQAPSAYFHQAKDDLVRKNLDAAAAAIRKVAGLLKLEGTRTGVEGKAELTTSAESLNKLAAAVEKGSVTNVQMLSSAFATAQYALADSHWRKATRDWNLKHSKDTGHELEAAVLNLAEGTEWAGREAEFDSSLVVKDALDLSKRLIEGEPEASGEVAQQLRTVGHEIHSLEQNAADQSAAM